MKIAILGHPNSWYLRDLQRAAKQKGFEELELTAVSFTQISASVEPDSNVSPAFLSDTHDLATYDAVLVRTMPPGSLEQVIFRMNALAMLQHASDDTGQFIPPIVLNSPQAIEMAVDNTCHSLYSVNTTFPFPEHMFANKRMWPCTLTSN